jgi:ketosteroid isomerase-like protein
MGGGNVEAIRRHYERLAENDPAALELFHPEVVVELDPDSAPEPGTYHGHEGVLENWRSWAKTWEDLVYQPERITEVGDAVVVLIHQTGRAKLSGVPVESRVAVCFEFRDGLVTRLRSFSTEEEALAAARGEE